MLFERLRAELRARHYSPSTEQAYVAWARRLVRYHRRHPREISGAEIKEFLDHLVSGGASASTHQQALCAIVFLFERVLGTSAPWLNELARPRRTRTLPVVLSKAEVRAILANMSGLSKLMASLLYGSGLRLLECARLRVKERSPKNPPAPRDCGPGNGYSPRPASTAIASLASGAATICTRRCSNARFTQQSSRLNSRSRRPATAFDTASRRTCWRPATTSAPSKSS
jgi:hypothetical protein